MTIVGFYMLPHEILDLTLEDLKNNNEFINQAYNRKMRELNDKRNEANKNEILAQEEQVRAAYEQLYLESDRKQYLANHNNLSRTAKDTKLNVSTGDLSKIEQAYNQFVETNYADKTKFVAKTESFASYDDFKQSNLFTSKKMESFNETNYPRNVLVLKFDSWKDALKFVKENKEILDKTSRKELKKELRKLIEKGKYTPTTPPEERRTPSPGF